MGEYGQQGDEEMHMYMCMSQTGSGYEQLGSVLVTGSEVCG